MREIKNYVDGLDEGVLPAAVRSARTDLELRQDFPRPAAQDAQWHYLAFGEALTPKKLAGLLHGADAKRAQRLLRGITNDKPTLVVT